MTRRRELYIRVRRWAYLHWYRHFGYRRMVRLYNKALAAEPSLWNTGKLVDSLYGGHIPTMTELHHEQMAQCRRGKPMPKREQ